MTLSVLLNPLLCDVPQEIFSFSGTENPRFQLRVRTTSYKLVPLNRTDKIFLTFSQPFLQCKTRSCFTGQFKRVLGII